MTDVFAAEEAGHMRLALDLARTGEGRVSPNPPVGCVLVKDGEVIGRGWHDRLGDLHAEAAALRDAGSRAAGCIAYVTLSPCVSHGRQPPCSEALVAAGVAGVVAAAGDPNPKNASGLERLRDAGVRVRSGLLREEAEYAARGFFKVMRHGLPWVTLKYAMTLDGKIAAASGDSRWVSGPESREAAQDMRSRHDAVLVGSGTVLADDPLLTVREPILSRRGGAGRHRQPLRIVADSRGRLPSRAAMLRPGGEAGGPVVAAVSERTDPDSVKALTDSGAEVLPLPETDGRISLSALLEELAARGIHMVLCEGGGRLAAGLLQKKLVDEAVAFIAPKFIGGEAAPGPVADLGIGLMAEAMDLTPRELRRTGRDIMLSALVGGEKSLP